MASFQASWSIFFYVLCWVVRLNAEATNLKQIFDSLLQLGRSNIEVQDLHDSLSAFIQMNQVQRMEGSEGTTWNAQQILEQIDQLFINRGDQLRSNEQHIVDELQVDLQNRYADYHTLFQELTSQYQVNDEQLKKIANNLESNQKQESELTQELSEFLNMIQISFDNNLEQIGKLRTVVAEKQETKFFEKFNFVRTPFSPYEFINFADELQTIMKSGRLSLDVMKVGRVLTMMQSHLLQARMLISEQFWRSNMELMKRRNILELDNAMIMEVAQNLKGLQSLIQSIWQQYLGRLKKASIVLAQVREENKTLPEEHDRFTEVAIAMRNSIWSTQTRLSIQESELKDIVLQVVKLKGQKK